MDTELKRWIQGTEVPGTYSKPEAFNVDDFLETSMYFNDDLFGTTTNQNNPGSAPGTCTVDTECWPPRNSVVSEALCFVTNARNVRLQAASLAYLFTNVLSC